MTRISLRDEFGENKFQSFSIIVIYHLPPELEKLSFNEICLELARLHYQRAMHLASGYQNFQYRGARLITKYWKGRHATRSGILAQSVQSRSYNPWPLTFTMVALQSSCSHSGRKLDGHWLRSFEQSLNSHVVIVVFDVDSILFEQYYKIDLDSEDREFVTNLMISVSLITPSHQGARYTKEQNILHNCAVRTRTP